MSRMIDTMPGNVMRSLRVDEDLWNNAAEVVKARGETLSDFIRSVLEDLVAAHGTETHELREVKAIVLPGHVKNPGTVYRKYQALCTCGWSGRHLNTAIGAIDAFSAHEKNGGK